MVRKLKYHEQKLLKKVDFVNWKSDNNVHEGKILRKFAIRKREHYSSYNKLAREVREIAQLIKDVSDKNPNKKKLTSKFLSKLFDMALIPAIDTLEHCEHVSASSFCRRRLASVMVEEKFVKDIPEAANLVEQGHVRVGTELVTDPAFLVTRKMADLITWANASKIRKQVESYNNLRDDFED